MSNDKEDKQTYSLGLRILAKAALIGAIALALSHVALLFRLLGVI